jgi:hypothetical protein
MEITYSVKKWNHRTNEITVVAGPFLDYATAHKHLKREPASTDEIEYSIHTNGYPSGLASKLRGNR